MDDDKQAYSLLDDEDKKAYHRAAYHKWYAQNADKSKANTQRQRQTNKDTARAKAHEYYLRNRERILARSKQYNQDHPEQVAENNRQWKQANLAHLREQMREYMSQRYALTKPGSQDEAIEAALRREQRRNEYYNQKRKLLQEKAKI